MVWVPNILSVLPVTPILSIVGQVLCLVRVGNYLGGSWSKQPNHLVPRPDWGLVEFCSRSVAGYQIGILCLSTSIACWWSKQAPPFKSDLSSVSCNGTSYVPQFYTSDLIYRLNL